MKNQSLMTTDLSKVPTSMSAIIENNLSTINNCSSVSELHTTLSEIFTEHNLRTKASNRLLYNVQKQRNFADALQTVYNSYLFGSKLAVGQQ